jgi:gluconate 2-dehydrogenase gamma chain
MGIAQITRRDFLIDSSRAAAAGGLAHYVPWLVALAGCAREDDQFVRLTPTEARAMRAFATQLIPSDDGGPGAEDAGAVHFVDRALARPFFADSAPVIHAGLADLDARARALDGGGGFASLSGTQQMTVMRQIEHDPFFVAARTLVVIGTFANPSYGGNRNGAGWALIGMEHRPTYTAPFGWYDAPLGTDPATHAA